MPRPQTNFTPTHKLSVDLTEDIMNKLIHIKETKKVSYGKTISALLTYSLNHYEEIIEAIEKDNEEKCFREKEERERKEYLRLKEKFE